MVSACEMLQTYNLLLSVPSTAAAAEELGLGITTAKPPNIA